MRRANSSRRSRAPRGDAHPRPRARQRQRRRLADPRRRARHQRHLAIKHASHRLVPLLPKRANRSPKNAAKLCLTHLPPPPQPCQPLHPPRRTIRRISRPPQRRQPPTHHSHQRARRDSIPRRSASAKSIRLTSFANSPRPASGRFPTTAPIWRPTSSATTTASRCPSSVSRTRTTRPSEGNAESAPPTRAAQRDQSTPTHWIYQGS